MSHDRSIDLKAFDERKTGVKGLIDEGLQNIPSIFIRPSSDLSRDLNTCQEDNIAIPVIDLAHVDRRNTSHGQEMIRSIIEASQKWGFFQIVNHGIPMEVLENVIQGVRMFHEQDVEVKKEFYTRDRSRQFKFNTNYDLYQSSAANWRDTLDVSTLFRSQLDPEVLPPVCRDVMVAYLSHITKLGDLLLELLSVGLGLKLDHLKETECTKGWILVGHYYPACPEPDLTLGSSPHSDPSFLTILLQDQIGGLQVAHQNQWVNVKPVRGALIVNIGDMLQMVSNNKLKSVHHRVIANKVGPRISIATFFMGSFSSPHKYGPTQEMVSEENPPLYREFTIQEFMKHHYTLSVDQPRTQYFQQTM